MADLRFDPVTQQWVSIAENRRNRPLEFIPLEQGRHKIICPFCAGNEDETPKALATYDRHLQQIDLADDSEEGVSWSVRVIPNKYPSFDGEARPGTPDYWDQSNRAGSQELILPTPRHVASIAELELVELQRSLHVARHRIRVLEETGFEHAQFFQNCRLEAGASVEHIHFQLFGTPFLPAAISRRRDSSNRFHEAHQQTLIQSLTDWEVSQQTRVVASTRNFVKFCPFASRLAFTIWIVPRNPGQPFSDCDHLIDELAELCGEAVRGLEALLGRPAYNLLLHQPPFGWQGGDHWYVEIFPRLTRLGGFEWSTDFWINPVSPETAAKRLRVVD